MKHLLMLPLLVVAFLACEKSDPITLDDLRSKATVWQLDAHIYSPGGGFITQAFESERTLQFWEGKVRTNGDFCSPLGPVGPFQEIDYDPVNLEIPVDPCFTDTTSYAITYPFSIDLERGYLFLRHPWCVEGCTFRYRRKIGG